AAGAEVGLPGDQRQGLAGANDWDDLFADGVGAVPPGLLRPADAFALPRLVQRVPQALRNGGADHVVVVHSRPGGRPRVRDGHVVSVVGRQPEHQVGERQVGDHLPVADQQVQPLGILRAQSAVLLDQFTHRGHGLSLRTDQGGPRTASASISSMPHPAPSRAIRPRRQRLDPEGSCQLALFSLRWSPLWVCWFLVGFWWWRAWWWRAWWWSSL